jgi:cytidylate kinase
VLAQARAGTVDEAAAAAAARALDPAHLEDPDLRTRAAGELASQAAVFPAVRAALLDFQRQFAAQAGGAVLDGRDIGTVICPQATAKLFVTASPEVRAERRYLQLSHAGETVAFEDILADIRKRDERDSHRSAAPLVQAADAVLLDTSKMTISEAADAARRIVEAARAQGS